MNSKTTVMLYNPHLHLYTGAGAKAGKDRRGPRTNPRKLQQIKETQMVCTVNSSSIVMRSCGGRVGVLVIQFPCMYSIMSWVAQHIHGISLTLSLHIILCTVTPNPTWADRPRPWADRPVGDRPRPWPYTKPRRD